MSRDGVLDGMTAEFSRAMDRSHNQDAEQAVLGGCFMKPVILDWLELNPDDFLDARHRLVWEAMQGLSRDRVGVDEVTVAALLQRAGKLESAGGTAYLAQLGLRVPTEDNTVYYAELVREHAVRRRVLRLAGGVAARVLAGADLEDLLSGVQRDLAACEPGLRDAGAPLGQDAMTEARAVINSLTGAAKGETVGIPTGVGIVDATIGGLPIGVPSVLGARPGMGKSTLALNIALHAARRRGVGVHVISYEDRRHVFAQRVLAMESGVDVSRIRARTFELGDTAAISQAADALRPLSNLYVEHGHGLDARTVIRRVRARRRDLRTGLVVIDYLQLIPHTDKRLRRDEQIEDNINAFATLAGQDDLAVLVVSQLRRPDRQGDGRPSLEDFRGSGSIEQVGKLILGLHRADRDGEIEVNVLKNHQGPTAQLLARWDRARCRIW